MCRRQQAAMRVLSVKCEGPAREELGAVPTLLLDPGEEG